MNPDKCIVLVNAHVETTPITHVAMLNSSVCVECGKLNSKNIYREYSGGAIQLSKCVSETAILEVTPPKLG